MLGEKLMQMGHLRKALLPIGAADVEGEDRTKQPDTSYLPISDRDRRWPTMVVEVGFAEDLLKFQLDARWWLCESQGDVRLMLIILDNRHKHEMTIEKWICDRFQCPVRQYHTTGVKDGVTGRAKASYQDHLIIGLNDLFLRDPQGPLEKDIGFTCRDWEDLADIVWPL